MLRGKWFPARKENMTWPYNAASGTDITVQRHEVNGSERLTEDDVRAYLTAAGYEAVTARLIAEALKFPGTWMYTTDRHRTIVHRMPGNYWTAADCAESEERIKAQAAGRARPRSF
jgi:hypothetical protein